MALVEQTTVSQIVVSFSETALAAVAAWGCYEAVRSFTCNATTTFDLNEFLSIRRKTHFKTRLLDGSFYPRLKCGYREEKERTV
jgi:hypothetical protein